MNSTGKRTPMRMDRNDQICEEEKSCGCKVFQILVRLDMCSFGDKVGHNLSMKGKNKVQ